MELTQRHAELCSSLGDAHRILMLYALAERAHSVNELALRLGLAQPTVSRHLKMLRESGVVIAERQGKSVYYQAVDLRILEAMDLLRAVVADQMKTQGKLADTATLRPTF